MNANGLYNGLEGYIVPGTNSGMGNGVANGLVGEIGDKLVYDLKNCTFWLDPSNIVGVNDLGRISSWVDKFKNYTYDISVAQPRLILNDSNFNNQPIVDFDTVSRGLKITTGPLLNLRTTTLVMVYQYLSPSTNVGLSYQSRVISDGDQGIPRSSGFSYLWNKNNNGNLINSTGFYQPGNIGNLVTAGALFNTNKYVVVVNVNLWTANNTLISNDLSVVPSWRINALGGDAAGFSGVFKLGEILLFNELFTLDRATYITNRLNAKYNIF
jgi:hypothetical protein